ncbi:MAG: AAC(3) family N-acetyltransferase [Brevefilum sp.]|nr:AAC(3) family N-acetyltransferase [Brevefilum sp.]
MPHGLNSPVGRVYELDGQVLLLGVGHDANTTIHLAEFMAGVRYQRKKSIIIKQAGQLVRFDYNEIDHCCENFNRVDDWLDPRNLQDRGQVGHAQARLMRSRDIVDVVISQLEKNETAFLHPPGVDEQCDQARASMVA